ncbi:hypothetical protein NEOLEDRAFT_1238122 [Neolentinus lepideus HHB14362 ss-1]|uniref:F-box domain-containing protein n=1 Tax=Neolentinus lepideus HHB14362 ss-1 TaxID=1314782 RepID=A0A165WBS2_9AGAM|nr:hypothetical protein NEOLEDRAFT_1238122 [Neolentinus lepideus HHB14362 ss-1]
MSLQSLPPELYTAILKDVPSSDLKQTNISLARALPRSPVPQDFLFHSIRLQHPDQVLQLYRCLESFPERALLIKELAFEADVSVADAVVNMVKSLGNLTNIRLVVCSDFPPERLSALLRIRWANLHSVGLSFRRFERSSAAQPTNVPCFDNILEALATSEPRSLRVLSIIQDAIKAAKPRSASSWVAELTHSSSNREQPSTFNSNRSSSLNTTNPFASTSIRPIFESLMPFSFNPNNPFAFNPAEPYLFNPPARNAACVFRRLDTLSYVIPGLTHLRLRLPSFDIAKGVYACTAVLDRMELLDLSTSRIKNHDVKRILGRFGCLKYLVLDDTDVLRGGFGRAEWRQLGRDCALAGVKKARERQEKVKEWLDVGGGATIHRREIRILPRVPTLLSLCATMPSHMPPEGDTVRREFELGWSAGVAELVATVAELKILFLEGVQIVKFAANMDGEEDDKGVNGLQDAEIADFEVDMAILICPVLCLVGTWRGISHLHLPGCGHRAGWDIWKDEL